MKRTILAAAVAAALIAPTGAQAQMGSPVKLGISGGVSFPTSDPIDEGGSEGSAESKAGYNVAGHLGFQVPMFPLGLRADLGYNKFDGKEDTDSFGNSGRADISVLAGTLNAIIQPAGILPLKPYLIGGIGAYQVKQDVRISAVDFGDFNFNSSKTSFGLNGGLGVRFGLGGMSTFAEARYHYVMNEQTCSEDEECFSRKNTTFVPVSFGIMF